ncbi:hypothetical protein Hanom_Chr09g00865261 [Helianthus anomalus]
MIVRRRTMVATGDLPKLNRYPSRVLYVSVSGNALESCLRSENCVTVKPLICEVEDNVFQTRTGSAGRTSPARIR